MPPTPPRTTRAVVLAIALGAVAASCGVGEDQRALVLVQSASWLSANSSRGLALTQSANLAVALRITNNQAVPLALGIDHFVLGTGNGYLYRAAPSTGLFPGGCNPGARLMAGATIDCTVLFSLPGPTVISQVGYEFDDRGTSTVQLAVPACSVCGAWCIDLANDAENCGACGVQVTDGAACVGGKVTCTTGLTRCGSACVALQSDSDNCGSCGQHVYGGSCQSGAPVCSFGGELCGQSCTRTSSDALNCGRCGATCPSSYACISGQCQCAAGQQVCSNGCTDLKTDGANCGSCGHACQGGYACSSGTCVYKGSGGGGGGGCSVDCSQFGLSCCGSSCC